MFFSLYMAITCMILSWQNILSGRSSSTNKMEREKMVNIQTRTQWCITEYIINYKMLQHSDALFINIFVLFNIRAKNSYWNTAIIVNDYLSYYHQYYKSHQKEINRNY